MDAVVARKNWRTLEPLHGFIYFSPEARQAFGALGLEGESGYFASRSAPMGPVTASVVGATFYNFHRDLVAEAMEGVWERVLPAEVLRARLGAVDKVLRRMLPDVIGSDELKRAADLLRQVSDACDCAGRPLAAGHQQLSRPDEPHLALWHDLAVVREYRGDGHIAALLTAGIGPLDALILHAASGEVDAGVLRTTRRWSVGEWSTGVETLADRGLVDSQGALTEAGARLRDEVELRTDELALPAWEAIGAAAADGLRRTARPWSKALVASGAFGAVT